MARPSRKRKRVELADPEVNDKGSKPSEKAKSDEDQSRKESGPEVVMKLANVMRATVVNRPSKVVRSPYMADIIVQGATEAVLCHSPALGCAGMIVPGSQVLVTPKSSAAAKSKYSLDLVDLGSSIVGIARTALERGLVEGLPAFDKSEIKAEAAVGESRFDFRCIQEGTTYYVEVKGVPCACIEDVPISPKKKAGMMEEINKAENKIAYFPDGYRKSKDEVISPRALKHVQHLTRLVEEKDTKCVLLFIVQRTDCVVFQPSKNDPVYREAVHRASQAGVKILAQTVIWNSEGSAAWGQVLPSNLRDDEDQF